MAEDIRNRDLAGVQVRDSTFNGASFRDCDLRGVVIRASWVEGMRGDAVRDESVRGDWSMAQTVRHLVFADDSWTGQMLLGGDPWHPWGLPSTDYPADRVVPDLGIDVAVSVPYDELLALHHARRARFGEIVAGFSDADYATTRTGTPGPAWGEETHTVADCVDTLIREHAEHRRFVERDLAELLA